MTTSLFLSIYRKPWKLSNYSYDNMYIFDGTNNSAPLLACFHDLSGGSSFSSTSGPLTFVFDTDFGETGSGWAATLSLEAAALNPPVLSLPADTAVDLSLTPSLSWTPPVSGPAPTQYKVYLGTANPPTSLAATVTELSYTPSSPLASGTTYYWKVVAVNSSGESTGNETRSFTTLVPAPANLVVNPALSSIRLSWSAVSDGADYYWIYRSTYNPPDYYLAEVSGSQLTYTDATASLSTDYYYVVKAVKNTILSAPTSAISAHLLPQVFANPTSFTINLNYGNLSSTTDFSLSNTGGYPYSYTLSGTDQQGVPFQNSSVEGFIFMGEKDGHGYYQSSSQMAWATAKALCELRGGHLLTISSAAEQDFIYQHTALAGYSWMGFTDEVSEGTWACVNGEPVTYTNWNGGEPNNGGWEGGNEDHCVFPLNGSTGWNDGPGWMEFYAILELDGYSSLGTYNGHRYYKSSTMMNWSDAKASCEKRGGHLVTLANSAENSFVYSQASDNCWVGCTDEVTEGVWTWVTGEPVTYTAWHAGEPNNYAGAEDYASYWTGIGGNWVDIDANRLFYSIMEIDSGNQPSVLSFSPSSGTINPGASATITMTVNGTGLTNGTYNTNARLVATDIDSLAYYPVTIAVDSTIPAPTGLTAVPTPSSIGLSWTASPGSPDNYRIYRSTYTPPNQLLAEVAGTQVSHTDLTAEASADYYYLVKTFKNSLESGPSNIVQTHLQPHIEISPATYTINITGSPQVTAEVTISNTGGYPSAYSLTGSDELGMQNLTPPIDGFTLMGQNNGHGYYQSNTTMTWTQARALCETKGGHLLTISDAAEEYFVKQHYVQSGYAWMGLTDEATEGTWAWVNGDPVSYTNWNGGEPNNGGWSGGNEDWGLISLDTSIGWNDGPNDILVTAILEMDDFNLMGEYAGHKYYKSRDSMTWQAAKTLCEQKGGHLVSLNSAGENSFVFQNAPAYSWIGITDEVTEGTFAWVSGEPLSYTNWYPGEPNNYAGNEDYAALWSVFGGQWADIDNAHLYNAILEYDTPSVLTFAPSNGALNTGSIVAVTMTVNATGLANGTYSSNISLLVSGSSVPVQYPVTINVNRVTITAPTGLVFDTTQSNTDAVYLDWAPNPGPENVASYKIQRFGTVWTLIGTVPAAQTYYIDSNLTGLSGDIQYRIIAVSGTGTESTPSVPVTAWRLQFAAPGGVAIADIAGAAKITWDPVTLAIGGSPATPTRYLVYASDAALPLEDYTLKAVVTGNEWTDTSGFPLQFYFVKSYSGSEGNIPAPTGRMIGKATDNKGN